MTAMSSEMRSSVAALSTNLAERNRTPWAVIIGFCSVSITILGGLGFLALQPIKDNILQIQVDRREQAREIKDSLSVIVEKMVTQKDLEYRTARGMEDRSRMEATLKKLDDAQVPRAEHERVWSNYDQRFADQQRQLDEMKQAQGNVYGARDFLLDTRERLDRLERQRLAGQPPP